MRKPGRGHGRIYPEVQDSHSLFPGLRKLFPIAIPEQQIADSRLLSHKTELKGYGRNIHIRKLAGKGQTIGVPIFSCVFHKDFHTVAVMPFIIHTEEPVPHTAVSDPPDIPHHFLKAFMLSEVNGNGIILLKARYNRMVDAAEIHGLIVVIQPAVRILYRSLAIAARIDIIDRQAVNRSGIILPYGKSIIHIIESTLFRFAHPDRTNSKLRIRIIFRLFNAKSAHSHIRSPPGQGSHFPGSNMMHGKQRKRTSRLQHPEILTVQILPHQLIRAEFILPVPHARCKTLIIMRIRRLRHNKRKFTGKPKIIPGFHNLYTTLKPKPGIPCFIGINKSKPGTGRHTQSSLRNHPPVPHFRLFISSIIKLAHGK